MKKLFLVIFIMAFSVSAFSQSWNNIVSTTVNETNANIIDLFTNKEGNHIVIQKVYTTPSIKYYLLNTSGSVVRSSTIETSSGAEFPNISGNNSIVYITYKLGNYIITKYSTNAGVNWYSVPTSIHTSGNTCNGVDATYDNTNNPSTGLQVVWATQDDPDGNYETYYYEYDGSEWINYKQVTDYGVEVGGFPTVSVSPNRVHVSYNTGIYSDPEINTGIAKARDKYSTSWQNPQQVINSIVSFRERIHAGSSKLFDFYYQFWVDMGEYGANLYVKERAFNSSTWSAGTELQGYIADMNNIVSAANTSDGKTHIVYPGYSDVTGAPIIIYRSYNGSSWSSVSEIGDASHSPTISAVSNDLFVVWRSGSNIHYRQYDAIPLAPQNLTIGPNPGDHVVRLNWAANIEPDLSQYQVWRKIDEFGTGWVSIATTTNTYYVDHEMYYAPTGGLVSSHYKIKAKDINGLYSPYSEEVSSRTEPMNKIVRNGSNKNTELTISEYKLQNYPNPFNPSTNIIYQVKEKGLVSLKVFDMLGREVVDLVNEEKEPGQYEVFFDGSNLPSGVYIYSIRVNNFTAVKKMALMK